MQLILSLVLIASKMGFYNKFWLYKEAKFVVTVMIDSLHTPDIFLQEYKALSRNTISHCISYISLHLPIVMCVHTVRGNIIHTTQRVISNL